MDREELFNKHYKYIDITIQKNFTEKMANLNHLTKDDMFGIGSEALWKACLKYEQYSHRFRAYAINCIKGAISTFMNRKGSVITFPIRETNEVKNAVGIVGYDNRAFDNSDRAFSEIIAAEEISVEEDAFNKIICEELLSSLKDDDRYIVTQIQLGYPSTQICKVVNMTQPNVLRRYNKALKKMKEKYDSEMEVVV